MFTEGMGPLTLKALAKKEGVSFGEIKRRYAAWKNENNVKSKYRELQLQFPMGELYEKFKNVDKSNFAPDFGEHCQKMVEQNKDYLRTTTVDKRAIAQYGEWDDKRAMVPLEVMGHMATFVVKRSDLKLALASKDTTITFIRKRFLKLEEAITGEKYIPIECEVV